MSKGINFAIGKKVIVRGSTAGVWFGTLCKKKKNEVVLCNARRLGVWIKPDPSMVADVSLHGITKGQCQVSGMVKTVWFEAIEIIPTTPEAAKSIEEADDGN